MPGLLQLIAQPALLLGHPLNRQLLTGSHLSQRPPAHLPAIGTSIPELPVVASKMQNAENN